MDLALGTALLVPVGVGLLSLVAWIGGRSSAVE
jgi:hypothetical protein